jgi:hypothetical protein
MTELTNEDRAERAEAAIAAYCDHTGDTPDESHFRDLLSDMMHLAARDGAGDHMTEQRRLTFDEALAYARNTFLDEGGGDDAESYRCTGCGRPEEDCSADPCAGVLADRGEADEAATVEFLSAAGFVEDFNVYSLSDPSGWRVWASTHDGGLRIDETDFCFGLYPPPADCIEDATLVLSSDDPEPLDFHTAYARVMEAFRAAIA